MPVELLIHAKTYRKAQKGFILDLRDVSVLAIHPWSFRESLPDYIKVRITDSSKEQLDHLTDNWKNELSYEELARIDGGRRFKISVNPRIITEFGPDKGIAADIKNELAREYGAVIFNVAMNKQWEIFDFPNPTKVGWTLHIKQIKAFLLDNFESEVSTRRHIFSPADVDIATAAGGKISLNKEQALARVVDRLA